jgi:hypothetical protein
MASKSATKPASKASTVRAKAAAPTKTPAIAPAPEKRAGHVHVRQRDATETGLVYRMHGSPPVAHE